jgi:hypothetical protein
LGHAAIAIAIGILGGSTCSGLLGGGYHCTCGLVQHNRLILLVASSVWTKKEDDNQNDDQEKQKKMFAWWPENELDDSRTDVSTSG